VLARRLHALRREFAFDVLHAHYAVRAGDAVRRVAAGGSALDPDDTEYARYHSGSPGNLTRLNDPQIDHDLEQGRHAVDANERKQVYSDYQQRMTQLLQDLFIGYDKVLIGANKRLKGLTVRPVGYDGNAYFDNAYLWSVN